MTVLINVLGAFVYFVVGACFVAALNLFMDDEIDDDPFIAAVAVVLWPLIVGILAVVAVGWVIAQMPTLVLRLASARRAPRP